MKKTVLPIVAVLAVGAVALQLFLSRAKNEDAGESHEVEGHEELGGAEHREGGEGRGHAESRDASSEREEHASGENGEHEDRSKELLRRLRAQLEVLGESLAGARSERSTDGL